MVTARASPGGLLAEALCAAAVSGGFCSELFLAAPPRPSSAGRRRRCTKGLALRPMRVPLVNAGSGSVFPGEVPGAGFFSPRFFNCPRLCVARERVRREADALIFSRSFSSVSNAISLSSSSAGLIHSGQPGSRRRASASFFSLLFFDTLILE